MSIVEVGPGRTPIFLREHGTGFPLLFLHGGWGYEVYPFDAQIAALEELYPLSPVLAPVSRRQIRRGSKRNVPILGLA